MAKKTVKKLSADEAAVPIPPEVLSDVERQDLVASTAPAVENNEDGRLPYPPRTAEGQQTFLALGAVSIPSHLWVARARLLGHSLTESEIREVITFDGEEVECTAPSGECNFHFQPKKMAHINVGHPEHQDGSLQTDTRLVSETNLEGVVYRGAYLAVPVNPKSQHSKFRVLGPLCRRDQRAIVSDYKEAGWFVKSFGQAEAEAFVASINARKEEGRQRHEERKRSNAPALGLRDAAGAPVYRGGKFRNNPHRANAGRQSRHQ